MANLNSIEKKLDQIIALLGAIVVSNENQHGHNPAEVVERPIRRRISNVEKDAGI